MRYGGYGKGQVVKNHAGGKCQRGEHIYTASSQLLSTQTPSSLLHRSTLSVGSRQVYILRFGRASGLISPSRTTYSDCKRAAKLKNLDRLIFPIGSSNALRRAGAIGERGSTTILSSERRSGAESFFVWRSPSVLRRKGKELFRRNP